MLHLDWESGPTFIYNTCSRFVPDDEKSSFNTGYHYRTCFEHPWQETPLTHDLTVDALAKYTEGLEPGIVVVDTVSAAFTDRNLKPGWEYVNMIVRSVVQPFHAWAHSTGWSVIFVHHLNKSGAITGSAAWSAAVDIVCKFWRDIEKGSNRGSYDMLGRLDNPISRRFADYTPYAIQYVGTQEQKDQEVQDGVISCRADTVYEILRSESVDKIATMALRKIIAPIVSRADRQDKVIDNLLSRQLLRRGEKIGRSIIFEVK